MLSEELLAELTAICDGAKEMAEGGYTFVYLPGLKVRTGEHASLSGRLAVPPI